MGRWVRVRVRVRVREDGHRDKGGMRKFWVGRWEDGHRDKGGIRKFWVGRWEDERMGIGIKVE